ncbi:prepilin-type N-terminal cleavage/methylation domain-containing protein [Polaromonas sp.]|uniref:prepilin-type N-terminal cleavage/methylation domain-containing protein n=1 Tax=Polaromonas sp. TaxID=1869339 RepID=UPI0034593E46
MAPTLVISRAALPPGGAELRLGRPGASFVAPTLATAYAGLPRGGNELSDRHRARGFTLLELLIVVAIMALATAGVGLSLRDSSGTALEREAQRLAVLLESARAQSRMTAIPVRWRITATGFAFDGLTNSALPTQWLSQDVQAASTIVTLGPEPVIGPQQIRLVSISKPERSVTLATDGVRPFSVRTDPAAMAGTP